MESLPSVAWSPTPYIGKSSHSGSGVRAPLAPLQPGRVNFEVLYDMGDTVIEAVPEDQRTRYKYYRGASLGKIAMNLARGVNTLNAGQDPVLHFTDTYDYAVNVARDTTRVTQLNNNDRVELADLTGEDPMRALPRIVYALDDKYNAIDMTPSSIGMSHGVVYGGYLYASMIDEYSRAVIEGLILR